MSIATINPATGETVKTFTPATSSEVDAAIARAYDRFADYRHTSYAQRAQWAHATADLLEAEAEQTAAMMTLEMGKTLASAKAEALKCAKGFRYYAENAEAPLAGSPSNPPPSSKYTVSQHNPAPQAPPGAIAGPLKLGIFPIEFFRSDKRDIPRGLVAAWRFCR